MMAACPILLTVKNLQGHGHCRNPISFWKLGVRRLQRRHSKSLGKNQHHRSQTIQNSYICLRQLNRRWDFPFVELENQSLSNVNPSEWIMVEVIADSGACETVLPKHLCNNIKLRESVGSKAGVEYEVASGKAVKNLGERHCEVYCEGAGNSMMMHFQVADIHRPLLSLSRAADQGFRSVLDQHGGYLEDTQSGEQIPIQRRGNLYIMQIWIRAGSDERPPDNGNQHFVRRG